MSGTERRERRARVLTGLLLAAIFVSGVAVGGGLGKFAGQPEGAGPGRLGPPLSQLGLSSEQEAKAMEILARHRPQIEAVLAEAMPKIQDLNDRVAEEVRNFLTPEQSRLLDEFKRDRRPPPLPAGGPANAP